MRRGPASRLALAAIRGYQRWISPYKGYRCALCAAPVRPEPVVRNPWRHQEHGYCDVPCDATGCDLPDLHCHGGGRACGIAGDLLEIASCGSDGVDCGRLIRRRTERCPSNCCGHGGRRQRNSADLDALARRIAERKRRRQS